MVKFDHIKEFWESRSTLRETSHNSACNSNLTESHAEVYDFDEVKNRYFGVVQESAAPGKSADALLVVQDDNQDINVFIEFKDCKVERNEIRIKIADSLLVFNDLTGSQLHDRKTDSDFILVYSAKKNPPTASGNKKYIENKILGKANKKMILFGLDKYDGSYFRKLMTYDEEEFRSYLERYGVPVE